MIQMKYRDLLHPNLQQILGKVANTQMAPAKSYEINKLLSAVRAEIKKTREESGAILKTFVKFEGDKPKFKVGEDGESLGEVEFIEPFHVTHPDYLGAFQEFEKKDAQIAFRPWSLEMISDCKLSAAEIDVLGPLLTDKPFLQAVSENYSN